VLEFNWRLEGFLLLRRIWPSNTGHSDGDYPVSPAVLDVYPDDYRVHTVLARRWQQDADSA
jgi:hypothetical protein